MQAQMQQLRSRPVVTGNRAAVLTATPKFAPIQRQHASRRHIVAAAAPENDSTKSQEEPSEEDINQRILSGEFTDAGSTKEKLTRPIRKALAQDPIGIGECRCGVN